MKLTPMSLGGRGYWFELDAATWFECGGRARARTLSRGRTSAERLRDLRNARREEDKWNHTFPGLARAKICRRSILYGKWRFKLRGARDRGLSCAGIFLPRWKEKAYFEGCVRLAQFFPRPRCCFALGLRQHDHKPRRAPRNRSSRQR